MHGAKSFIIMAFFASLVLPGSAFATVMLDLSADNATFAGGFASGTTFTDPAGLGWDLTISSGGGTNLTTTSDTATLLGGMGVAGGATGGIDTGETVIFAFNPYAMLEGFTLVNGANDTVLYIAVGDPSSALIETLPNAGSGGGNYFISVESMAGSLSITNLGVGGYRIGSLSFVPEPAVIGLLGIGLLGMGAIRPLRMKKSA